MHVLCVITCYTQVPCSPRYLHDLSVMGFSKVSREISINAVEITIPCRFDVLFRSAPTFPELIILSLFVMRHRRSVSQKTRLRSGLSLR